MARRAGRVLGLVGSTLVAVGLSHSVVYLIRFGSAYGEALAHAGHDLAWTIAVWSANGLGAGLAIAAALQLLRLRRAARALPQGTSAPSGQGLKVRWLVASGRLAATTAILLTIQENVERAGAGLPVPGIGLLLSADYPWAVLVVAAVGSAVGLVVALFPCRRDVLVARLRASRRVARRPITAARP